jgi:hypothetical protein
MPYPFINREVKGAFRWYEAARLRHRNRVKVTDPDPGTALVAALPFPKGTILPFQIRCDVATNTVVSWRMYDLASPAVQTFDLDSHIPELVIAQYANPDRAIICLETPLIDLLIPSGRYEMEIVTNTGATLYSETFEILCGKVLYSMPNSALSSGTTNWGYGDWAGLLGEVITGAGVPPRDGTYDDEQVANLTDNLLYTWNGTIWNSSTPVNGTYWSAGIGTQWYIFTGGAWASAVTPPIAPAPDSPYGAVCWNGSYAVPWVYTPPAGELPGFVLVQFTPFGGAFAGSFDAYAGDTLLGTFTAADTGVGQEFTVYLEAGQDIYFIPSSDFDGCITNTNFEAVGDGTECMTKLEWSNCGDIGTTAYTIGNGTFTNILYLRENDEPINGNVWDPIPTITVSPETNQRGDSVPTRSRKDVNWTLFSANLPRHLIDAISEIPTVDSAFIRAPWASGEDEIVTARVEVVPNDMIGDLSMIFQVDEATVNSGCCDVFDRPCAEPCGNADGIYGISELVIGNTYLYLNSQIATYCSLDCEDPVDENGFNQNQECPYGIATTSDPLYPVMRWDGEDWVLFAEITSVEAVDEACLLIALSGTMPTGYVGQMQESTNGVDWTNVDVGLTAAQFLAGVQITRSPAAMYLRLSVVGADECVLGYSDYVQVPCMCPAFVITTNLEPNCFQLPSPIDVTVLLVSSNPITAESIPMADIGDTVQAQYRINGGAWINVTEVPSSGSGWWAFSATYPAAGDILEARVIPLEHGPDCEWTVSAEFSCPE